MGWGGKRNLDSLADNLYHRLIFTLLHQTIPIACYSTFLHDGARVGPRVSPERLQHQVHGVIPAVPISERSWSLPPKVSERWQNLTLVEARSAAKANSSNFFLNATSLQNHKTHTNTFVNADHICLKKKNGFLWPCIL